MPNFGEAWTCLAVLRESKLVRVGLRVAQGIWPVICLEAIAKGNKGEGIFIPIADLVRRSLRTGRCRSAFGVRGAVVWSG